MEITIEKLTKEKFQEFGDVLSLKDNYNYKKIHSNKFITNNIEIMRIKNLFKYLFRFLSLQVILTLITIS